jgi:hypothetical protein
MICPLLAARGRMVVVVREMNCYGTLLWSRLGASNEKRRDHFEGVCEEDQLNKGGGDPRNELLSPPTDQGKVRGGRI